MKAITVPITEKQAENLKSMKNRAASNDFREVSYFELTTLIDICNTYDQLKDAEESQNASLDIPVYLTIAAKELGVPLVELPDKIKFKLFRLNRIVENCGGSLKSRQAIALVILDYLAENREKN